MNNSQDSNPPTPEDNAASAARAAEQARIDAIYAFEEEPEINPKRPVVNKKQPLAPKQIYKQGIPGLPKWLIFIFIASFAAGPFLAAIFAFTAALGDMEFALQSGGIVEIDRHTFGAFAAIAVLSGMAGFLQFYLRVRNTPTVARKALTEIALYLTTILAVVLFVLLIWPRDILSLYVRNGTAFQGSSIWISTARSKDYHEIGDPKPWFLVLSDQQRAALKTKETIATCQTDISIQLGPLHWQRSRRWDEGKLASPTTIEDIQRYCVMGMSLDTITASASAKSLLKTQVGETLDFTDAEIAAAEGKASETYQLSARARYFLFKTAPKIAATIAVETETYPSDFTIRGWNGGYQAVDNRIAAYECDDKYAKFLISKGIQPTSQEVETLLSSILWELNRYEGEDIGSLNSGITVAALPTNERDPGAQVKSAKSIECATLFNTWIKTSPLAEYEPEASRDLINAHSATGYDTPPLSKKIFDELHKSVMLHSGSTEIFSSLGQRISYDSTLATWMEKVNPADVSRKIQLNDDTYKMWCDETGYCSISQENARMLLKAFIKP